MGCGRRGAPQERYVTLNNVHTHAAYGHARTPRAEHGGIELHFSQEPGRRPVARISTRGVLR